MNDLAIKRLLELQEPTPCDLIRMAASRYYAEPLADLKLKAPLEVQHREADTEATFGDFIAAVPKPGEIAGCLRKVKGRFV